MTAPAPGATRALTLHQPWASLVACGAKRIETRSWGTAYRGPLLIHAGLQKPPRSEYEGYLMEPVAIAPCTVEEMILALGTSDFDALPRGVVVAVAELTRCDQVSDAWLHAVTEAIWRARGPAMALVRREFAFGNYDRDRWMWLLWDVKRIPQPIGWPGQRRLWSAPEELVAQVREALPAWQA